VFGNFILGDGFSFSQRATDSPADQQPVAGGSPGAGSDSSLHPRPPGNPSSIPISRQQDYQPDFLEHPFQGHSIAIKASLVGHKDSVRFYLFQITTPTGERFQINNQQLRQSGYHLSETADCSVRLTFGEWTSYAVCAGAAQRTAERLVSERSSAPSSAPAHGYVTVVAESANDVPVTRHIDRTNNPQ
tara:strand:- start:3125 stop:3688 length:564 start_codon:yes stop_codon:yes gene_type:complete